MKKIIPWINKKGHSAEVMRLNDGSVCVLLHDPSGINSEGFGDTPDAAFMHAHGLYKAARHRASLTTSHYSRRRVVGVMS